MAPYSTKRQAPELREDVIQWLLESDPAIRWQVMRDLTAAPIEQVASRARTHRYRGRGGAAARPAVRRWDLERSSLEPRLGFHHAYPDLTAGIRPRSSQRPCAPRSGTCARQCDMAGCRSAGVQPITPSLPARWSRASTGKWQRAALTSDRMSRASSTACLPSSYPTAAGTARRRTDRRVRRSTPRSACWRPC